MQTAVQEGLILFDERGQYSPRVDLLRLDIQKRTSKNPELLSDIKHWTPALIQELKGVFKNKEVCCYILLLP